jgi:lipopolysaccharide/colanic/teichoic acid biosynthesis glycosyltransferase
VNLYQSYGKRILDLTLTIPTMVVGVPIFLFVAVLVRIKLGSPVLFRQLRPGWHERPFTMYKFRSMLDEHDAHGNLLSETERHTSFGRKLRRTSLDELPELWNVLRGEMSLVGPRPLLMEYIGHYTPEHNRRHAVRPGISGWAQINGRNELMRSERLALDVWYVDNMSLRLDLKIIAATLAKVVHGSGVRVDQYVGDIDDVGLHPQSKIRLAAERAAQDGVAPDGAASSDSPSHP